MICASQRSPVTSVFDLADHVLRMFHPNIPCGQNGNTLTGGLHTQTPLLIKLTPSLVSPAIRECPGMAQDLRSDHANLAQRRPIFAQGVLAGTVMSC